MVTRLYRRAPIDFSALRRELELPARVPARGAARGRSRRTAGAGDGRAGPARPHRHRVRHDRPGRRHATSTRRCASPRPARGIRVYYAIADVTAFVPLGGALETETWARGETIYLPDGNVPLAPEGAV